MINGMILKGIGGLYTVWTSEGLYDCKPRGLFRHKKMKPLVGDHVVIEIVDESLREGLIVEIEERFSELFRPSVANVEQVIVTFSVSKPTPNFVLLDKILVLAEKEHLEPIIVFNKMDLADSEDILKRAEIYRKAGYVVLLTTAKEEDHLDDLKKAMSGKVNVFAGPSGVGKSSLTNKLKPGLELKTGEVSEKIKRGKHTTRHTELIQMDFGGWVVDTPGFTSLEVLNVEDRELNELFREFNEYSPTCKFNNCIHVNEPGCAVKSAVEEGNISSERYKSYLFIYDEITNRKERY